MASVRLIGIAKRYDDTVAVQPLDLQVADGEFVTLLGPSGCGKTTTLRMIAGFVAPTAGRVEVGDDDITDLPPQKRAMGMVFQDYSLFPHLNVEQNIAFGLVERKIPSAQREPRVRELLDLIRLPQIAQRYPAQLSGGQQQRVALARALAHTPRVLLMDEPFGALDAKLREAMQQELRTIQKKLSITTIFVTHDQAEAMHMSDRIAVMNHGRIEQLAPPNELYERPRTRFVADFVGKINFLEGTVVDRAQGRLGIDAVGARWSVAADSPAAIGARVTLAVRPERIRFAASGESSEDAIVLDVVVERWSYFGNVMHTSVSTADGVQLLIESPPTERTTKERVRVTIRASDVSLVQEGQP
jgi:putative spermidine/putrescine transport system ATP-binding protein